MHDLNPAPNNSSLPALLRLPEVIGRIRLGRSSVYAMVQAGVFPAPIRLGERSVAWRADEVEAWLKSRIEGPRPLDRSARK